MSDAGAALISVAEAGLALDASANAAMRRLAARLGLALEAGNLRSEPVQPGDAAYAVTLVANGAREIAKAAFDAGRQKDRRRFRERVQQALCNIFATSIIQKGDRLSGYSEDSLRFDYLVTMSNRVRLVIDAPIPDGSSIASVVLRQVDIKAASVPGMHQAIVYDEADHWRSTSLAQLKLAQVPLVNARFLQEGLNSGDRLSHRSNDKTQCPLKQKDGRLLPGAGGNVDANPSIGGLNPSSTFRSHHAWACQ